MLTYILSALSVIVIAGIFTAWVVYEINKEDEPKAPSNKKHIHSH